MGELIVRHYPTPLLLKAADHSYVECGTGAKGWACWGGKKNGKFLRSGIGSTLRADAIAEPDEKAGISCYLINGVCHQASNRILQAAGLTVDGVRGYTLSVVAFGQYGRETTRLKRCQAPLFDHAHISGDLPECLGEEPSDAPIGDQPDESVLYDFKDQAYMAAVAAVYESNSLRDRQSGRTPFDSQMELFKLLVEHRVRRSKKSIEGLKYQRVIEARERFETGRIEIEHEISGLDQRLEFASQFNVLTYRLQDDLAEILDSQEYQDLLGLSRDERIVVADPDILNGVYEPRPGPRGASP